MNLYREIVIHGPQSWQTVVSIVKANAKGCIDSGSPLRVILTTEERKRNVEQNRRYWGAILKAIADQAWAGGKRHSADVWHEYFARKFGVLEEITLPDGENVTRRKSTTAMTVAEFSEYMDAIEAEAATELGVVFG